MTESQCFTFTYLISKNSEQKERILKTKDYIPLKMTQLEISECKKFNEEAMEYIEKTYKKPNHAYKINIGEIASICFQYYIEICQFPFDNLLFTFLVMKTVDNMGIPIFDCNIS
jgi:hypothetical protein